MMGQYACPTRLCLCVFSQVLTAAAGRASSFRAAAGYAVGTGVLNGLFIGIGHNFMHQKVRAPLDPWNHAGNPLIGENSLAEITIVVRIPEFCRAPGF